MKLIRSDRLREWVDLNTYCIADKYEHTTEVIWPDELLREIHDEGYNTFESICDALDTDPTLFEAVKAYIMTGGYE